MKFQRLSQSIVLGCIKAPVYRISVA